MNLINSIPDYYKLRQVSRELDIEKDYDHIVEVNKELEDYLLKTPNCAGISAIQFGEPIRMFLIKEKGGKSTTYINPVITSQSEATSPDWEGCMSFPSMYAMVHRDTSIQVSGYALNKKGKIYKIKLELTGFQARVFQHELDHLNGMEMFDRAEDLGMLRDSIKAGHGIWTSYDNEKDYFRVKDNIFFFANKPAGKPKTMVGYVAIDGEEK